METAKISAGRIWLAVAPAMVLPFLASLVYFVALPGGPATQVAYGATKLFTVGWPLIALPLILGESVPRPNLRQPHHREAIPLGVVTGLFILAALALALQTPLREVVEATAPQVRQKAESLGFLENFWLFALSLSLVNSLVEEFYWRWFVYGQVRRALPRGPALVLGAGAFAAHHFVVASGFAPFPWYIVGGMAVFLAGVIWNLMFEAQRTLVGAWVAHIIVDLGILWVGYRLLTGGLP